jgi:hypothetical protein
MPLSPPPRRHPAKLWRAILQSAPQLASLLDSRSDMPFARLFHFLSASSSSKEAARASLKSALTLAGLTSRRRHQPRRPPLAKIRPGSPAPAMGARTLGQLKKKRADHGKASTLVVYFFGEFPSWNRHAPSGRGRPAILMKPKAERPNSRGCFHDLLRSAR